jgi:hypothetical protein
MKTKNRAVERELRRRAWYSLYVLDCLLSLQLGRPLAIVLSETIVHLPSPVNDMRFDLSADIIPDPTNHEPQFGDYFRNVIQFSHIVGRAVRELYGPGREQSSDSQISKIEAPDGDLLQWKSNLPRSLRFDLGHAFDTSATLRKQVITLQHLNNSLKITCS